MAAHGAKQTSTQRVSKESVAKQFVRLYYCILNTHHEYLHQFYGSSSSVVVSEMMDGGKTMTETADTEESVKDLLKSLYADVSVKVDTAVPQFSLEGSVLLLITGTMTRKDFEEERVFTQALVLAPQDSGYFILTDTLHVLGRSRTCPIVGRYSPHTDEDIVVTAESLDGRSSIVPTTPRAEINPAGGIMMHSPDFMHDPPLPPYGSGDMQTSTPPAHEADPALIEATKSSDSDDHDEDFGKPYMGSMGPGGGIPPAPHGHRASIPRRPPLSHIPPLSMPVVPPLPGLRGPPHRGHSRDMSISMGMHGPPGLPQNRMHRRSMSLGSDPRIIQAPPGHGVFIARLPFGIQADDVAEAFSVFGPILGASEGIQVRDGRNGCYAFVTFESAASATAAIQKGAVVQGKRVYVEPRYPRQEGDPLRPMPPPPAAPLSARSRSGIPPLHKTGSGIGV